MKKETLELIITALEHSLPQAAHYPEPVARHAAALAHARLEYDLLKEYRTVVEGEYVVVIRNSDGKSIGYPISGFWSRSPEQLSQEAIDMAKRAADYVWG